MKVFAGVFLAATLFLGSSEASPVNRYASVSGVVLDASGAAVPDTRVILRTPGDVTVADVRTDRTGAFETPDLPAGTYVLRAEGRGFRSAQQAVRLAAGEHTTVALTLQLAGLSDSITVTAVRGELHQVYRTAEFATVTDADILARRAIGILPLALREEPGVHIQQTSTSQGSPFVRGLTGQQVVTLVDGVRYNNSTFRPGANQYTALIDPLAIERVEIVRGPAAVQYGSDSLGGTINFLTRPTDLSGGTFRARGGTSVVGGSADRSVGGSAWTMGGWRRWTFVGEASGRRNQDLRAGGGLDSHSVVTRLLGLPSTVLGTRLQDTRYTQYGASAKIAYQAGQAGILSVEYLKGAQRGARRYDQLNGGLGNLLHRYDPQALDFGVARYERTTNGFLETFSTTFSVNSQRDDREVQNINNSQGLLSRITQEYNRTTVLGYQAQGTSRVAGRHALAFGGEFYDESVASRRTEFSFSRSTGGFSDRTDVRARFPNGATYQTLGVFADDSIRLSPRLTASFGVRFSRFRYEQTPEGNPATSSGPAVPAAVTLLRDATFRGSAVFSLTDHLNLTGNVARGFRAPNVNDFAAIGLSGLGFEVTTDEARSLGGRVRRFDGTGDGEPLGSLGPEESYSYEVGLRLLTTRASGTLSLFDSEILNSIERRTLLLPPGATGLLVGGQSITRQDPSGAVFTALSPTSVFVRTNGGHVRMRGIEGALTVRLHRALTVRANASSVFGRDLRTGRPPGLENGIPPTHGFVGLEWQPASGHAWLELYSLFAAAQRRLSDNDLEQARIGGIRTQQEIAAFFANGAAARGLVRDGILLATGETVSQVVRRVLGADTAARVPLFLSNPGYLTLNVRGGVRMNSHMSVTVIVENLLDRNYRVMGSGIDAAGRNVMVRHTIEF